MRKRGVESILIISEAFRPLLLAQAKARNVEPHLIVVKHPVGGLSAEQLAERIDTAFAELVKIMDADST